MCLDARRCDVVLFAQMKDATISLKIERVLKMKLLEIAKQENRSLSNYIENLLKADVAKHEAKTRHIKLQ